MSEGTKNIRKRDCVKLSNKIIERCKLQLPRVVSIDGIRSNLFTSLLQVLYHRLPDGIIEEPASTEDEIANVQAIVNHLALDLIHIDLSHISGADVIAGDPRAIYNLLEIFCGLHKYLSSTSIGQWNLEDSLAETNSELSSQPSSEESASGADLGQDDPPADPGEQDASPPLSRPSSGAVRAGSAARVPSVPSVSAARSSSAARVRSSSSGVARAPSSGSAGRPASGAGSAAAVRSAGSVQAAGSAARVPSGMSATKVGSSASAGRVPSSASAGRVPSSSSAGRVPSSSSAARVPSSSGSAAKVPSSGSAARVPSSGSAVRVPSSGSAGRVPSSGSAGKVASSSSAGRVASVGSVGRVGSSASAKAASGGASATRVASVASAGRVASTHSSATRVPSSGSGLGGARSSSGPLPASSISAGGEAEASLLPSSESAAGPPAARRRSASSGGGSGGAGAAGSSGAGAEPPSSGDELEVKPSRASRQSLQQPELSAADTETSEEASPLRAPSAAAAGEFDALGRASASRPSVGAVPGAGSGSAVQLTGSIDHHHYHHYEGEDTGESSQLTELTTDAEEEEEHGGYEDDEREEDTEEPTLDSQEEDTAAESEADSQPQWGHGDSESPEDTRGEDATGEEEEDELGGHGDVSRQLSEDMQQLMREASAADTSPEPQQRASATEQQRSVGAFRTAFVSGESTDGMRGGDGGGQAGGGGRPSRRELSAPSGRRPSEDRRRRRSGDCSSASEPGVGAGARLAPRNVETIAEIRETGTERAITETTREQAGDQLQKETVRREVRRKVSSAPAQRQMSYSKQTTRRSVCSDGVTDWLESQADDTQIAVDGREADVFEYLRREFPYVHVSAETKRRLLAQYRHQMKYIMSLVEPVESRKIKIRRQEVLKRQALMTDIMRQQKSHDDRFRRLSDSKRREAKIRNMPRDSKISCLRAQRYVSSFQQQFQSRSAFNKSKEELLLRAVFEEMLEIQRSRLRSVRKLEKQSIDEFYDANGYTADLNRVHQYYEANFRELAELLAKERNDLTLAQKQQRRLNDRIRREFRDYMEADVRSLNDKIVNSWQPQFRELDADRVRSDLYEANWKFCVQ